MTLIAQLSDLHLTGKVGYDPSYHKFLACLELAVCHHPKLLVLTGDLVNDGQKAGYDWLFDVLKKTHIDFVCLAGNHDVTHEQNSHLPFNERMFYPVAKDKRLSNCTALTLGNWQVLLIDSAVAGQIYGTITDDTLIWLSNTLGKNTQQTLIALHHHPLTVGSAWIDAYKLTNSSQFWQTLAPHQHAKVVICGHVHQAHTLHYAHTTVLTAPAVSRQFVPFCDEFGVDETACGIRLIWLKDKMTSQVVKVKNPKLKKIQSPPCN